MGLTKVAITRPIFIWMLIMVAILGGLFAYRSMRLEENPEVQFGVITITTVYPGAGPDEVSTLISRPLEESVSGVNGLLEVTSVSLEGVSSVVGNFEVGTNMDVALSDIRAKVDAEISQLPKDALKPSVNKIDGASSPVLTMAFNAKGYSAQELRDIIDDKIKDRFARLKGVSSISISGGDEREVQVRLKRDKMLAFGIGAIDVQRALQGTSLNVPSGRMTTGDSEYAVRVLGEFKKPEDIAKTVIRLSSKQNTDEAVQVKLSDIAEIVDTAKERREYTRLNGTDAVIVSVQKAKEGNAVQVSDAAKAVIEGIEKDYSSAGMKITTTDDAAVRVRESLLDLVVALVIGIILVTAIVHLFLHDWRGTLIVGLAIPVCLMATLMILWVLGFTLNSMTLLALSLAIGVLVDDAIVVLENIYRHLRMGEDPVEAAINGRSEIGLAAIAITLADVVVFLPMGFMGGVVGQFFKPLGIGFAVAVMLSLFVSFTVTPMLASRWYKIGEDVEEQRSKFAVAFDNRFERFAAGYGRVLRWALDHRWFVFISGFVILLGVFMFIGGSVATTRNDAIENTVPLMKATVVIGAIALAISSIKYRKLVIRPLWGSLLFALVFPIFAVAGNSYAVWKKEAVFKGGFAPPSDQGEVLIKIETAPGTSLNNTLEIVKGIEKTAMSNPDARFVLTSVGSLGSSGFSGAGSRGSNYAAITVTLNEKDAILDKFMFWKKHEGKMRSRSDQAVAGDLIEKIGKVAGAKVVVSVSDAFGFGAPIQLSLRSDDRQLLQATALNIYNRLNAGEVKGVISPDMSSKPGKPEFKIIPDEDRMAASDLSTADLSTAMRLMYEGNDDVKMRVNGREYPVRVMMDLADRNNPELISSMPVKFDQGNPIFLPQVAKIVDGITVDKVERRSRQEEIQVSAQLLTGYAAGTVQAEIDQWLEKEKLLPEGVKVKPLGQADVQQREMVYLIQTLLIGLILVFVILASLYDNLLYPFIIQLAQPQAFVGALLALMITDKTLNIVGFIGLIALVGLVGKNAILLVDYTNTLRAKGKDRREAILEAGPTRLKPITMTTLAVLLGMLPVALAIGRGSEFRETLGIIIIGGITLSTLLTLLVIPCSYTIFDDLSNIFAEQRKRRAERDAEKDREPTIAEG